MNRPGNPLERIQRIKMRHHDGLGRAEVVVQGLSELPAGVVLEAAEQLRQVLEHLEITDLSIIAADNAEQIEN